MALATPSDWIKITRDNREYRFVKYDIVYYYVESEAMMNVVMGFRNGSVVRLSFSRPHAFIQDLDAAFS
jgi:hypothetical protein